MADSKDILEISKALQGILLEVKNAARLMGQASEKLSTVGINKLTDEIKQSLKQRKLLNDLEADAITDHKKLSDTLDTFEKQLEAVQKIEEDAEKQIKRNLKSQGIKDIDAALKSKKSLEAQKAYITAKLEEIGITTEHANLLKNEIPLIRKETEARTKAIASTDGLRAMQEKLKKTIEEQIKGFSTLGNAASHLKKAFFTSYDQMNRISSKGLLGTFTTLQLLSPKLMMSAQDLEDVLSKNRDIINQLGGGLKGVQEFGDEIYKTGDQLRYLGKDWAKAGANFIELSKKSGLTPKDGKAYRQNLNQSIESFKNFSAMFGDTPDQYKALMEGMQDDETIRQRLNGLSKTQLANEMEEQRQRAYNLKLIGLSNEQIVEFNKKLNNIVDPRKAGDIGERAKNALMLKQTYAQTMGLLQTGTPEQKQLAAQMKEQQGAITKIADISVNGSPAEIAKAIADNPDAAAMLSKGMSATDQMKRSKLEGRDITWAQTGNLGKTLDEMGKAQNTATAQGKNIKDQNTPDQLKELEDRNRKELLADRGAEAEALKVAAAAYETVSKTLEGPFAQALLAGVAALMAFNTAIGIKGILGGLGSLGGGLKGVASLLIGNGGLMGILGRLGAVGAAGAAGYAVGEYVVNPLLNKAAESISGTKGETVGTAIYSMVDNLQGMGILPGQSDAQKQQQSQLKSYQDSYKNKISKKGYITKKEADMYRSNGVQIDISKIKDEGATTSQQPSSASGGKPSSTTSQQPSSTTSQQPSSASGGMPYATTSQQPSSASGGMPYDFNAYAKNLSQRESGGNYGTVNTIGFVGKYQFGAAALEDLGIVKKGVGKKGNRALNDPANWNTPGGLQGFLNDSTAQENAFKKYTNMHYNQLLKAGVITPTSTPDEIAGYLATAHLKGIGGAIDLKKGKITKDAYGTSTQSYFALGSKSQGNNSSFQQTSGGTTQQIASVSGSKSQGSNSSFQPESGGTTQQIASVSGSKSQGSNSSFQPDSGGTTQQIASVSGSKSQGSNSSFQPMSSKSIQAPGPASQFANMANIPGSIVDSDKIKVTSNTESNTESNIKNGNVENLNIEELKKQTALLVSIAQNTAVKSINAINKNGYKQDTAIVMSGIAG